MALPPTLVLALLVGLLQASLSLLVRGGFRRHLVPLLPAALVGAVVGTSLGLRMPDPLRFGDVGVLWASAGAWVGMLLAGALLPVIGRAIRLRRGPRT
jgi:hypothetical protein